MTKNDVLKHKKLNLVGKFRNPFEKQHTYIQEYSYVDAKNRLLEILNEPTAYEQYKIFMKLFPEFEKYTKDTKSQRTAIFYDFLDKSYNGSLGYLYLGRTSENYQVGVEYFVNIDKFKTKKSRITLYNPEQSIVNVLGNVITSQGKLLKQQQNIPTGLDSFLEPYVIARMENNANISNHEWVPSGDINHPSFSLILNEVFVKTKIDDYNDNFLQSLANLSKSEKK